MDPLTILAALGPLAVELGKNLIGKYITKTDYVPTNVADWLSMEGQKLAMFKAINDAGGGHESYRWVEAVTRLQRPIVAGVSMLVWSWSHTYGTPSADVDNFAACIGFYLFADRTLFKAGVVKR